MDIKKELSDFGISDTKISELEEASNNIRNNINVEENIQTIRSFDLSIYLKCMRPIQDINYKKRSIRNAFNNMMSSLSQAEIENFCKLPRWSAIQACALVSGLNPRGLSNQIWVSFFSR